MNEQMKEKADNEILFSRSVKAGKRIYYIDVKMDRRNELYISITESKRLKDNNEQDARPTYEKHKIFLYREDVERFMSAFQNAVAFVHDSASKFQNPNAQTSYTAFVTEGQEPIKDEDEGEEEMKGSAPLFGKNSADFRIDFDF